MKKYLILCLAAFFAAFILFVSGHSLAYILKSNVGRADAKVGAAVINGDKIWTLGRKKQPLLSVFKVFIAVRVLNKLEIANKTLDTPVLVTNSSIDKNQYSPMLKEYKTFPVKIPIRVLIKYMMAESDNNAADILLNHIGGPLSLDKYLESIGFGEIEISVNEKGMKNDAEAQYLNKAYPVDTLKFLKLALEGDILNPEHKKFLKDTMLETSTGKNKLKAGLPPDILFGHKTGSSQRKSDGVKIADNDIGFVIFPDGKMYYIAVFITDSKMSDKENEELTAKISKAVYKYILRHKKSRI